ncbi:histidinol-phosphate transaminase [Paracoccus sp. P2]|uniref:histidinol-phosphate transaminase n=1 Tax=Paracoccus sp. P2 TaxID=3248840 RepID=UPI00391F81F6
MQRFWSPLLRGLTPYSPGEQPAQSGVVKLNTNELPFGPSPLALAAIREAATDDLRLYPDPQSLHLREALARYHHVSPRHIFVGNGSDEILAFAFAALLRQSLPLFIPDITYSFYRTYCRLFDITYELVPLSDRFVLSVDDFLGPAGAIAFANPNAPTGISVPLSDIRRLLQSQAGIPVLIDEAYVDFGGETAVPLIADFPNLLVVRTMSKSRGLAGLRIGYAIGAPGLIEALERVKDSVNSYPLDRLAQVGAIAALEDEAYFRECVGRIIASRLTVTRELRSLEFDVLPSSTNFVFTRHPGHDGLNLLRQLKSRDILVRHFSSPRTEDFLRITIGSEDQNARLLEALRSIILP